MLELAAVAAIYLAAATCAPYAEIVKHLRATFHEEVRAFGTGETGVLLVLLRSPDGSTWTLVQVTRGGVACLLAAGSDWSEQDARPPRASEH